jgi:hypothetical protein
MPMFLKVLVGATIVVIISVGVAMNCNLGWLKSRGIDFVVFITTFTSFVFSVGITGRIAIYVSEYDASVAAITGGLIINLALFFVPVLLFISSLILGIRLIRRPPKQ